VARNDTALTLHGDGYAVLLITDLDLPKLDGLALCAAMVSDRPEPFLLKPLDPELLGRPFRNS
jgi:DNA-binding response OmpR family regulator